MNDGSGNTDMDDVPYILTAAETALVLDVLYFAADVYSACTGAVSDFAKVKRFQELADKIARRNRIIIE
jgi:hypothetical protein